MSRNSLAQMRQLAVRQPMHHENEGFAHDKLHKILHRHLYFKYSRELYQLPPGAVVQ